MRQRDAFKEKVVIPDSFFTLFPKEELKGWEGN